MAALRMNCCPSTFEDIFFAYRIGNPGDLS